MRRNLVIMFFGVMLLALPLVAKAVVIDLSRPVSAADVQAVINAFLANPTPVATAPGAPTDVTATGGNAQATVTFTAPASNGGAAITGYTVTSTPAGGVDSNAGTTGLSHVVTSLTNGTAYTFTATATNSVGTSGASAASNAVTPVAPTTSVVTSTASSWALGGTDAFNGATTSLVTDQPAGGAAANAAKIAVALDAQYFGTTFLTLKDQEFCTTAKPTITLEVYAPAAGLLVDLKLEQDGDQGKNIEMLKTTSAAGWQTLTFNCITDSGGTPTRPTSLYVEGTVYNKMSLLPNFLAKSIEETWYFDQLTYDPTAAVTWTPPVSNDPTVKPATPTLPKANVISIIGTTYGDMVEVGVNPNWGQSTIMSSITVQGDTVLKYDKLTYQGMDLSPASGIDVTGKTMLHIDVWAATTTAFDVFLISKAGAPTETAVKLNPTTNGWNSFDIPLSSYTGPDKTQIYQFKFVGTPGGNTVYIDNLYFW
ncbi:MAG: fibronectin type III domain-containing protein [Desulfuromonadaceae bacterium]